MDEKCPACGASVAGGRAGCQALWEELSVRTLTPHRDALLPEPAFDAYCLQHPDRYCASAKSYAAHLTRLCCGLEHRSDPGMLTAIQQWLNGTVLLDKPATLASFGKITIADVYQAPAASGRAHIAQAWIEGVWEAYSPQQALARAWLQQAIQATHGRRKRQAARR